MDYVTRALQFLAGDPQADRVVPPTGFTVRLTIFTAAAMTFLAVFALALSLAAGRLADRWSDALARTATVRISAVEEQLQAQTDAVLEILRTTPGITEARALDIEEQRALLAPWLGPDVPIDDLPVPQLVELTETEEGFDAEALRLRLSAETPGAVLDDHTRWRRPLVEAAFRLRMLGLVSMLLIALTTAAMIILAAQSALAANARVIQVLRLVGARDTYIARAFVRRFTGRALFGAIAGTALGMIAIAFLPDVSAAGGFLTGLGFAGLQWLWPLIIPPLVAVLAFWSTRATVLRMLKELT